MHSRLHVALKLVSSQPRCLHPEVFAKYEECLTTLTDKRAFFRGV